MAELKIRPESYVDIIARNWFSPYLGNLTQSENTIRFYKNGLGEIYAGYDFLSQVDEYKRRRSREMSIVKLGGNWEMNDDFTLGAVYRRDFNSGEDLERTIRLDWAGECYSLYFSYTQEPNDQKFKLGFDLLSF